jgi:hypothetical protein
MWKIGFQNWPYSDHFLTSLFWYLFVASTPRICHANFSIVHSFSLSGFLGYICELNLCKSAEEPVVDWTVKVHCVCLKDRRIQGDFQKRRLAINKLKKAVDGNRQEAILQLVGWACIRVHGVRKNWILTFGWKILCFILLRIPRHKRSDYIRIHIEMLLKIEYRHDFFITVINFMV